MPVLAPPTLQQLKEFYPVSASMPNEKILEFFNYVKNTLFLEMFGYTTAKQLTEGAIELPESDTFIGLEKFTALCVAYQIVRDPLVSTNFGAKIVDRQGAINPSNQQKSISLIPLEQTISAHYRAAAALLGANGCKGIPNWGGYFSYKITRL